MTSYIQNIGFTKTRIQNNNQVINNEIEWNGDYDGKIANIDIGINDNGNKEIVSMQLNNSDLRQILGIQPVEIPLEKRLMNDFLRNSNRPPSIILEGALTKRRKSRKRKKHTKRRKSRRLM